MTLRDQFLAFDTELEAFGVPRLGDWWRTGVGRWLDAYERGEVLELWACAGRGSAKSTALYKLATFFAVYVPFAVPVGERHYAIVLSRLKEEAAKGIAIITRWLELLGIGHHLAGDAIELDDVGIGIRVVAASVAAASGWRAVIVLKDERSKWAVSDMEERDAEEIDTSAAAMTTTHANAPLVAAGSAWGKFGEFYEVIVAGDVPGRVVLGPAPTWVATDGRITEAMCRRKERDERRFRREYACEFQGSRCAVFDADAIAAAFTPRSRGEVKARVMVIDASSGRKDSWTYGIVEREVLAGGASVLRFDLVDGIEGKFYAQDAAAKIVAKIAGVAKTKGIKDVHGDQRESLALASLFAQHGIKFHEHPWTSTSKPHAVDRVRAWLRDRTLSLPLHARLHDELHAFEERITPSGSFTFGPRGSGHDDYVALLITAAMVDMSRGFRERAAGVRAPMPAPFASQFSEGGDLSVREVMGGDDMPLGDFLRQLHR